MSCERWELMTPDYVTGRLTRAEHAEMAAHLEGCGACRKRGDLVTRLYELELEDAVPKPREVLVFLARRRLLRRFTRAAAVILVAAVAAAVLLNRGALGPEDGGSGAASPQHAALRSVALELPDLPRRWAVGSWLEDREEALLLAQYTGRPMLSVYFFPPCPRCRSMMPAIESDPALCEQGLDDFVLYREAVDEQRPEALAGYELRLDHRFMLPGILIDDGQTEVAPVFEVGRLDAVEALLRRYEAARRDPRRPLDEETFAGALATMQHGQELAAAGRPLEALVLFEELAALGLSHRTRFATEAERLSAELEQALRR